MSKIAISVIVDLFNDEGTTVRPKRVAELLKDSFETCFITRSNRNVKELDGVKVHIVQPAETKLWNLKLFKVLTKNDFDFVYCSSDWFGFLTYFLLSKFYNYKIIFEAHTIISEEFKERGFNKFKVLFYQVLEKFVIRNSDFVVALSENIHDFYSFNKNIDLIHVFIDEDLFISNHLQKRSDDKKIVGLIGPFDEFGNKYFLEFLNENIDKFDIRISFVIIGKCQEKIDHQQISYTGYINSIHDYVDVLSSLDGLLVPSKIATLGPLNKIIEAMACSVPVFTTPKGIVGLYNIKHGEEIYVFEEDELVQGLNNHIFNNELINVAKNARMYVEKNYSKKTNKKKLLRIFNRLNEET
jgi:glycosyltransferase involved in cell wall biosynthesis